MHMQRAGLIAGTTALLLVLLAWRGCAGDGGTDTGNTAPSPATTTTGDAPQALAKAGAGVATGAAQARHAASTRGAVSTLQRYLTALGEDPARADTFWAGGAPTGSSSEADLRSLTDLRALRVENRSPIPLDSLTPPDAVEIPVQLRISTRGAPLRHYQGWYRLRRAGDGWQITSAAIDASPPRR